MEYNHQYHLVPGTLDRTGDVVEAVVIKVAIAGVNNETRSGAILVAIEEYS
jgi:hypothetical protein